MRRGWILGAALLLMACTKPQSDAMQGYGEADYIYLASQEAGVVSAVLVREGDHVEAGAPVFRLDPDRLAFGLQNAASSRAALVEAAQAAEADSVLARRNLARTNDLFRQNFVSRAKLDIDRAAAAAANARADQARRQLNAAGAETGLARQRVSDLNGVAPQAGSIERIFHRPGEVVAAGAPIAALLTPANMKVKFFAPQALLARLPVGARVLVSCDGCASNMSARVSRVATEPQFTPPVIYSLDQREKLVFLVEARAEGPSNLRPGVPVDVRIAP